MTNEKTLTRKDAYDGINWQPGHNTQDLECLFEEGDDLMCARIPADSLAGIEKPEDLEPLIKKAVELAQPIFTLWPIKDSFMSMCFQKPPVYKTILEHFAINVSTTLFTFADVIYNPATAEVPDDYIHHEEVHAEQQGHNNEGAGRWWARYFSDPYFRIDQEAKAYATQYDWWCKNGPKKYRNNREERTRKLDNLASTLAGPTYGNVINKLAAKKMIKSLSKTK